MAIFRAFSVFSHFYSNVLPLDEDVIRLKLKTTDQTKIGAQSYQNGLTIDYWDSRAGMFFPFYSPAVGRTIIGGTNFALDEDQRLLDGTINAIAHRRVGTADSGYTIEGLKVSAIQLADALAVSSESAFNLLFSGNDRFFLSAGDDGIIAGAGNDTVKAGNGDDTILAGDGNDIVRGEAGADVLYGGAGSDRLFGGRGNDTLLDGIGNDLIDGGAGRDTFAIEFTNSGPFSIDLRIKGPQVIGEGASVSLIGVESLTGGTGNDTLIGNSQSNSLSGGSGSDLLIGYGGSDWLTGNGESDVLTGGGGADRFYLRRPNVAQMLKDMITDFNRADADRIVLPAFTVTGLAVDRPSVLDFARFYSAPGATSAQDVSDRIIYNPTSGLLYFDPDGKGGKAAVAFAELTNADGSHPALSYTDFLLI